MGTFFDVEEAACVSEKLVDCGSRGKMFICFFCFSFFFCDPMVPLRNAHGLKWELVLKT